MRHEVGRHFCFAATESPARSLWLAHSKLSVNIFWMNGYIYLTYLAGIIASEKMIRWSERVYVWLLRHPAFHWQLSRIFTFKREGLALRNQHGIPGRRETWQRFSRPVRVNCSPGPDWGRCARESVHRLYFFLLRPPLLSFFQILHLASFSASFRGLPGYFLLANRFIVSLTANDLKELMETFMSSFK